MSAGPRVRGPLGRGDAALDAVLLPGAEPRVPVAPLPLPRRRRARAPVAHQAVGGRRGAEGAGVGRPRAVARGGGAWEGLCLPEHLRVPRGEGAEHAGQPADDPPVRVRRRWRGEGAWVARARVSVALPPPLCVGGLSSARPARARRLVLCRSTIQKLGRGSTRSFKCPYCPVRPPLSGQGRLLCNRLERARAEFSSRLCARTAPAARRLAPRRSRPTSTSAGRSSSERRAAVARREA